MKPINTLCLVPLLGAASFMSCKCKAPESPVVDDKDSSLDVLFEGYKPKNPASANSEFGRMLVDGQTDSAINNCFAWTGEPATGSAGSVDFKATTSFGGGLDIGTTFEWLPTARIGGNFKKFIDIKLHELEESKLTNVHLAPTSVCVTNPELEKEITAGKIVKIITGELKAGSLLIRAGRGSSLDIDLGGEYQGVEAEVGVESENEEMAKWEGVKLFFARKEQCFKVTASKKSETVGFGNPVDLASCTFLPEAIDDKGFKFSGTFSCMGADPKEYTASKTGIWVGEPLGDGASYSLRVQNGRGVKRAYVELVYWTVVDVACEAS